MRKAEATYYGAGRASVKPDSVYILSYFGILKFCVSTETLWLPKWSPHCELRNCPSDDKNSSFAPEFLPQLLRIER